MGKKRSRRQTAVSKTGLTVAFTFCVIAFSLTVRWWGIGKNIQRGDRPFKAELEVLNGSGEDGLAMKTRIALIRMGIDVLRVGDAEHYNFAESLLIDRKGNPTLMKQLSRLTGCRRVILQVQERPLVDATFVIGHDRKNLKIYSES